MGCFLACFGSSKDQKRRSQSKNKVLPRHQQRHGIQKPLQSTLPLEQDISAKPTNLISEVPNKLEEQLSLSTRKKVTFDTNIKAHEPILVDESAVFSQEDDEEDIEKQKGGSSGKSSLSHSLSEDDSLTSSVGSYPPNHRYQNCRDSDDEADVFGCEDSDLDGEDEELEEDYGDCDEDEDNRRLWSDSIPTESVESRREIYSAQAFGEEEEVNKIGANRNARDRSVYVHSVLNPVENLTQWKAVKSKGTPPLKPHKENFTLEQEAPRISFSSEPTFKHPSFSFKTKSDQPMTRNQEIAVDASLSNWLVTSETTPTKKASHFGLETISSEKSISHGSNSVMSIEDRPILGALTVEELRQFSASPSPRRSPSRSPDEMPILGTVGTYWRHGGPTPAKDSGSASSFKGIPNTTSKYREDKRVNWHSTPFETRLERALNRPAAEA